MGVCRRVAFRKFGAFQEYINHVYAAEVGGHITGKLSRALALIEKNNMKPILKGISILLLFCSSLFANTFDLKCNIGIEKLMQFSTEYTNGNKVYEAWDLYENKEYFGFYLYYSKIDILNIGISYSRLREILNQNIFSPTDHLSGAVAINKFGISLLLGKTYLKKYHPYFIIEPGYYYACDNTFAYSNIGIVEFKAAYFGHNFYGLGVGGGFDYYITNYMGITSSVRYDLAMVYDYNYIWLNYPSIQIGLMFSY